MVFTSARVVADHREVAGPSEVGTDERDAEQAVLSEETKLERDMGQHHRRVHQALMVCHQDIAARRIQLLQALKMHANAADCKDYLGPGPGDPMLRVPGFVE
jgi:hypothetical protein